MEEYGAIREKYQIDFIAFPQWVPEENGGFKTIMQITPFDLENQNNGFVAKEN